MRTRIDWRAITLGIVVTVAIIALIWRYSFSPRPIEAPDHMQAGTNAMKFDPNNPAMSKTLPNTYLKNTHSKGELPKH